MLFCLHTAGLYLHFATAVIHEITTALGIYCFRYGCNVFKKVCNVLLILVMLFPAEQILDLLSGITGTGDRQVCENSDAYFVYDLWRSQSEVW